MVWSSANNISDCTVNLEHQNVKLNPIQCHQSFTSPLRLPFPFGFSLLQPNERLFDIIDLFILNLLPLAEDSLR